MREHSQIAICSNLVYSGAMSGEDSRFLPPVLTVAVPVFNSMPYLQSCLESIENELISSELSNRIEIIVLDNGSTDGSLEYAMQFDKHEQYSIFTNGRNLGGDESISRLAHLARGEYVWFLGSQERLLQGSLRSILDKLNGSCIDFLLLNYQIYSENENMIIADRQYGKFTRDREMTSKLEFILLLGGPALAMSANVFRTSNYRTAMNSPLVGENWGLYERALDCIVSNGEGIQIGYLAEPTFTLYQEVEGWWTTEAVLLNFIGLLRVLNLKLRGHPIIHAIMFRRQVGVPLRSSIRLGERAGVRFDKKLLSAIILECRWSISFWLFSFPTLLRVYRHQRTITTT